MFERDHPRCIWCREINYYGVGGCCLPSSAQERIKSMTITDLIQRSHETAIKKGWWNEVPERSFGDQIALMHSELSEALEEYRSPKEFLADVPPFNPYTSIYVNVWGGPTTPEIGQTLSTETLKPEGIAVEFADVLIRIADTCGRYDIPLEEALSLKLAYNETRPVRHGGKRM